MRRRPRATMVLLALVAGCGGGSGGMPTAPVMPELTVALPDGRYVFTVYSTGIGCVIARTGQAAGPAVTSVSGPVQVTGASGGWRLAVASPGSGSMTGTLARNGSGVSGTVTGSLIEAAAGVVLEHQIGGTGAPGSPAVTGAVTGQVSYVAESTLALCSENSWSLRPE